MDLERPSELCLRAGELLCELLTTVPSTVTVFENDPQMIEALVVFYQQLDQPRGGDSVGGETSSLLVDLLAILLLSARCRAHFLAASGIGVALEAAKRGGHLRENAIRLLSFAIVDGDGAKGLLATADAPSFILSHLASPSRNEAQVTAWTEESLGVLRVQEHLLSIALVLLREATASGMGDPLVTQFWDSGDQGGKGCVMDRLLQSLSQLHARLERPHQQRSETVSALESCQNLIVLIIAHLAEHQQAAASAGDHQRPTRMASILGDHRLTGLVKDRLAWYAESCENAEYRARIEKILESLCQSG